MIYEAFLNAVKTSLTSQLGKDFTISIETIPKNNGLLSDGLCIRKNGAVLAPTIYLSPYFKALENGRDFSLILEDIRTAAQSCPLPDPGDFRLLASGEEVLKGAAFRVVNETANQKLLKKLPHISCPGLDLALVFFLSREQEDGTCLTSLIYNRHLTDWNLSEDQLWKAALVNTPRLFPARIRTMEEVMKELAREAMGKSFEEEPMDELLNALSPAIPLYVLSNPNGLYGASCLFYPGILKDFAEQNGSDYIILPSSIHEVLLTPVGPELSYEELAQTVSSINAAEVPLEDRLSNHIYRYSRKEDSLTVAFPSSVPVGTTNP